MRKLVPFAFPAILALFVVSLALAQEAQPPARTGAAPPAATPNSTLTVEQHTQIVQQIENLGGENWERSAKSLEQQWGGFALSPLMVARKFNSDATFQKRCDQIITQIERNIKEGLAGGRSKPEK